jgi:hypothetical protein
VGWFGATGLVPLLIWWWHVRPRPSDSPWQFDLDEVRSARFGSWRTLVVLRGRSRLEIFSDELAPVDLARLRRELKARIANEPQTQPEP